MTFSEWKKALRRSLDDLPDEEIDTAIEYYKEMFADMTEAGRSEEDILAEFGAPAECAERILRDRGYDPVRSEPASVTKKEPRADKEKKPERRFSILRAVGIFFFSLLIYLPIAAIAFSLIISFAAVAFSGAACAAACALVAAVAPIGLLIGAGGGEVVMSIGICLVLAGVGVLLAIGFFYATKYTSKGALALTKLLYR